MDSPSPVFRFVMKRLGHAGRFWSSLSSCGRFFALHEPRSFKTVVGVGFGPRLPICRPPPNPLIETREKKRVVGPAVSSGRRLCHLPPPTSLLAGGFGVVAAIVRQLEVAQIIASNGLRDDMVHRRTLWPPSASYKPAAYLADALVPPEHLASQPPKTMLLVRAAPPLAAIATPRRTLPRHGRRIAGWRSNLDVRPIHSSGVGHSVSPIHGTSYDAAMLHAVVAPTMPRLPIWYFHQRTAHTVPLPARPAFAVLDRTLGVIRHRIGRPTRRTAALTRKDILARPARRRASVSHRRPPVIHTAATRAASTRRPPGPPSSRHTGPRPCTGTACHRRPSPGPPSTSGSSDNTAAPAAAVDRQTAQRPRSIGPVCVRVRP